MSSPQKSDAGEPATSNPTSKGSEGVGTVRRSSSSEYRRSLDVGPGPSDNVGNVPGNSSSGYRRYLFSPDHRLNLVIESINSALKELNNADHLREYLEQIPGKWNDRDCNNNIRRHIICFARELKYGSLEDVILILDRALAREKGAEWFTEFARALIDVIKENPNAAIHKKRKRLL